MFKLVNAGAGRAWPRRNAPGRPAQTAPSDGPPADDPRWVFAARAAIALRGGQAAILSPDKRRSLERLAGRMGLRPFDAALVIAIVQDAARRGESWADRGPAARLALVRPADAVTTAVGVLAASSVGLAVLFFAAVGCVLAW